MSFNFKKARVRCLKIGAKVHVVKALISLREDRPRAPNELEILSKAVDYIKALEAEVFRLESSHVNNTIKFEGDATRAAESVGRGFIGRLLRGGQS
jgi:hypothetical protein